MSDIALTPAGFVPTVAETREQLAGAKVVRDAETSRRLRLLATVMGGWVVGGVSLLALGGMTAWHLTHPLIKPELRIGLVHDDNTYSAPVPREDLPPSQRYNLLVATAKFYVKARENYVWEAEKAGYDLVSKISTPDVRDAYQRVMLNKKDPHNPETMYGAGIGAGRAVVSDIRISIDKNSPFVIQAYYLLHVQHSNGTAQTVRKIARMTWTGAASHIPLDVQQEHDPAGIAFSGWESYDDTAGG